MTDVENLRYEAGKDARAKGEPLHENASEEYTRGYSKGSGIGSNVMPKKFGKGGDRNNQNWLCVCGYENKPYMRAKIGGEVVCWFCRTPKAYGEDKQNVQAN